MCIEGFTQWGEISVDKEIEEFNKSVRLWKGDDELVSVAPIEAVTEVIPCLRIPDEICRELTIHDCSVPAGWFDNRLAEQVEKAREANVFASVANPVYRMRQTGEGKWAIVVDEGWRTSVLCWDVPKWSAEWLVDQLKHRPMYVADRLRGV
jgi:hypothetical protein